MIVDGQQRAQSRAVKVLQGDSDGVWVQGIERGEQVIVRESQLILAGMQVSINVIESASGSL